MSQDGISPGSIVLASSENGLPVFDDPRKAAAYADMMAALGRMCGSLGLESANVPFIQLRFRFDHGEAVVPVGIGRYVVGRSSGCDIRLESRDVSRRHVVITVGADGVSLRDLGSTYGTWIGSESVLFARVPDGGCVRLGRSVSVRIVSARPAT